MTNIKLKDILKNKIILIFMLIFIISRFFLINYKAKSSDLEFYSKHALEYKFAKKLNINFYDFHENNIQQAIINKTLGPENEYHKRVGITPLALRWIILPNLFINYHYNINTKEAFSLYYKSYSFWFKFLNFILEVICFFFLLKFILSAYKDNKTENYLRIIFFIFCGIIMADFIYDRYDYALALIIGFALIFLISKKNYIISFIFLALAIHHKIVSIFILPLWIIGSLPSNYFTMLFNKKSLVKAIEILFKRAFLLLGMIIILALFFFILSGIKSYNFLFYYTENYLQIESIYSSLLLLINFFKNININIYHKYGNWNINSSISKYLDPISTPLVLLSLVGLFVLLIFILYKRKYKKNNEDNNFAMTFPEIFIFFTFLSLSFPLALSKNFAPQYFLWFVPIITIMPLNNKYLKVIPALFLIISLISVIIFPYLYFSDIVNINSLNTSPTLLGRILLITKNFLFIILNVLLVFSILHDNKKITETA